MVKHYKAEIFDKNHYELAEAPFYDERTGLISFVDILNHKFYTIDKDNKYYCFDAGQMIGSAIPGEKEGTYVLAGTDGLFILENDSKQKFCDVTNIYESYQRSNDAKADLRGRLFFGSSTYIDDYEASGNLFCYSQDGIKVMQANTKLSNGMAWGSDKKSFYFSDSMEHAVLKYDYDIETGAISNRRVLFTVDESVGVPDGFCIDSNDNIWLAIWGGHRIECHSGEDGSLLAMVEVDAEQTSSCCFIGDSNKLFITTAGVGVNGEHDGCLFTCEVDATGVLCNKCTLP